MRIRLRQRRRPQGKRPPAINLPNRPVASAAADDAAADENASMGNRWRKLRDKVKSTALLVLGRARGQRQD
nr:unnamed protein product [Spirometra erinaceieuropaei]